MDKIKALAHIGVGGQKGWVYDIDGICPTLPATQWKDPTKILIKGENMEEKKIGNIYGATGGNYAGNVYDKDYIAPTINTCQGGNRQPMIVEEKDIIVYDDYNNRVKSDQSCMGTLTHNIGSSAMRNGQKIIEVNKEDKITSKIRKITPKEAWRLMGFNNEDIEKCEDIDVSNTQLYKQAGNSIITNCVSLIAQHLYKAQYDKNYVCYDE